jgi:hypothetical protein
MERCSSRSGCLAYTPLTTWRSSSRSVFRSGGVGGAVDWEIAFPGFWVGCCKSSERMCVGIPAGTAWCAKSVGM